MLYDILKDTWVFKEIRKGRAASQNVGTWAARTTARVNTVQIVKRICVFHRVIGVGSELAHSHYTRQG
jgi:hypothetical protein